MIYERGPFGDGYPEMGQDTIDCEACDAEIYESDLYCPNCGEPQPPLMDLKKRWTGKEMMS